MEKKLTRDQHLITLVRENADKTARIKELEDAEKDFEKRLKKLEKDYKHLFSLLKTQNRKTDVLKEKANGIEHEVQNVKQTVSSITKRR